MTDDDKSDKPSGTSIIDAPSEQEATERARKRFHNNVLRDIADALVNQDARAVVIFVFTPKGVFGIGGGMPNDPLTAPAAELAEKVRQMMEGKTIAPSEEPS